MMVSVMISDGTFALELNDSLKRQKIKIKERKSIIADCLADYDIDRDETLDHYENMARAFEAGKKQEKHIPSEFKEQCDFVEWFKKEYKGVVIMSIRNGGSRTPRERVDQLLEGLHVGAADIFVPKFRLWIEFKRIKGGIQSDKQKEFERYVIEECGDDYILALGCEDGKSKVLKFLEEKGKKNET